MINLTARLVETGTGTVLGAGAVQIFKLEQVRELLHKGVTVK